MYHLIENDILIERLCASHRRHEVPLRCPLSARKERLLIPSGPTIVSLGRKGVDLPTAAAYTTLMTDPL